VDFKKEYIKDWNPEEETAGRKNINNLISEMTKILKVTTS